MPAFLRRRGGQTVAALVGYVALTLVMTWPIVRGLTRDVPADLGDSLFVMWAMAWDAEAIVAMASGAMSFDALWNANIFHPTPLSLTFSEHLVPQALQGLPAYLATGNIVLAYNLVFLATFALSGLAMFLFVRELTGSARVAFVAGLFYAFLPYRLGHLPHMQTLSSQWMPFALYGVRRHFETGRAAPLAGGVAAFVVQGLSTGYYLLYFAPLFGAYVLWEMTVRRRLRDARTWALMTAGAAASLGGTLPFLLPYAEARATLGLSRPFDEVVSFSADLYAYVTAVPQLHVWGPILNRFPRPEGDLFMGTVPIVLALGALGMWLRRAWTATDGLPLADRGRSARAVRRALAALGATLLVVVTVALTGGFVGEIAGVTVRVTSVTRALLLAAMLAAWALWRSPRLRAVARALPAHPTAFLAVAFGFTVLMSLGPIPRAGGVRLGAPSLYAVFLDLVPGYDGLRAPARFAMVGAVMLAPLAAYALVPLAGLARWGTAALVLIGVTFLAEAYAVPLPVNLNWQSSQRYAMPWPAVHRLNEGPLAYRHLLSMPDDTIVLELPFGDQAWDLRYVYYAGLHGRRIVNGYSGYIPNGYRARAARLASAATDGDGAWGALVTSGATHAILHTGAYVAAESAAVSAWLQNRGAKALAAFDDGDVLFALPAR